MRPEIDIMLRSFNKLNNLYFGGRLPKIDIKLTQARTRLGSFNIVKKTDGLGRVVSLNRSISISICFDRTLQEYENTLAHEMIHYAIHLNGPHDETPHGQAFCRYRDRINAMGKHNIEITSRVESDDEAQQFRRNYFIVSELKNGNLGITIVASTRIWDMDKTFSQWDMVKSHSWWWSTDPFFSNYPRVTKPKIYHLDQQDYDFHVRMCALPLKIVGNRIIPIQE